MKLKTLLKPIILISYVRNVKIIAMKIVIAYMVFFGNLLLLVIKFRAVNVLFAIILKMIIKEIKNFTKKL